MRVASVHGLSVSSRSNVFCSRAVSVIFASFHTPVEKNAGVHSSKARQCFSAPVITSGIRFELYFSVKVASSRSAMST